MADGTGIEWTHRAGTKGETWNPIVGCSIATAGCTNCYAMRTAARIEAIDAAAGRAGHYAGTTKKVKGRQEATSAAGARGKEKPVWTGKIGVAPDHIFTAPLRWRSPPWNPGLKMRGEFAVHAGLRIDRDADEALRAGVHPVTGRPFVTHLPLPRRWETGGMVGAVEIVDAVTSHSSEWFVGPRGLVLRKSRTHPFIPVAGQLGFFDWRGRIIGGESLAPIPAQGSLL